MRSMVEDFNFNNISIAYATHTSDPTPTAINLNAAESVIIFVPVGTVTTADADNYFAFTVTYSTDDVTYTALPAGDYVANNSWDRRINATAEANAGYAFGIKPSVANISSIKVVATETGTANAAFGAFVILGGLPLVPYSS